MSVQMYLKYKYTYENAGFCILCIDNFKILKFLNKLLKFSMIFTQRPCDVSCGQNRYVTLP